MNGRTWTLFDPNGPELTGIARQICVEDSCKTHRSTITSSSTGRASRLNNLERDLRTTQYPSSTWSTPHRPLHGRCRRTPVGRPASCLPTIPPPTSFLAELPFERPLSRHLGRDTMHEPLRTPPSARVQTSNRCSRRSAARQPAPQFLLRALNVAARMKELPAIVLPTKLVPTEKPQNRSS